MKASTGPPRLPTPPTQPNTERIKQKLIRKGVYPTPKIIHILRKKELQKSNRRLAKQTAQVPPLTNSQKQAIAEEAHFQTLKSEYKSFTKEFNARTEDKSGNVSMIGKPWERLERLKLRELASESKEHGGDKLKSEHLRELSDIIENERDKLRWLLDDDIEMEEHCLENERRNWTQPKRRGGEVEAVRFLLDRLSGTELTIKDWKFSRMMKQSDLQFTEGQMLKIVEGLGDRGQWRHALSVVEWVYNSKEHRFYKSRFVYTKLLAVLGKARRPHEALQIFNLMRGDCHIYPDMPAYHSIAVVLGQAGRLKELMKIIECMKQKPSGKVKNMRRKNWDPVLQPDVVVFNAVLNACVPTRQWRGVSWVFEQFRKSGLKPNGATYGLAMEVMLQSRKYDLVHEFFRKMKRSGEATKALTYKVLVKAFWEEGKINEAIQAVRDMEQRGVVGMACVYYELACCLCNNGRWQEAMLEIEKLKKLPRIKPLQVAFTGMILSSMEGGYVDDCVCIFEHSKDHCAPDIGIINAMLKVYGRNDMFFKAKELFEETKRTEHGSKICSNDNGSSLNLDVFTYSSMLEASTSALQWEYFEHVYKEMALSGYQLDQSKHASLLVEAARAGKWYLLEHAFDTILEAGEIPHPSFFTEMVCQAILQHNYERAVVIVNTMAYAPFQVSKQQWIDLFEENGDRITRAILKELLDTFCNSDLSMEASVLNLSRALHSICESDNLTVRGLLSDGYKGEYDGDGIKNMQNIPANIVDLTPSENLQVNNSDTISMFSVNHTSNSTKEDADMTTESGHLNYSCNGDGSSTLPTNVEGLVDDLFSVDPADCFDDSNSYGFSEVNELELDMLTNEIGDSHASNLPLAHEILETWKESRKKDGIFFSFLLNAPTSF